MSMNFKISYIFLFFSLLLIVGCGGGSPPTKNIIDVSDENKAGRVIVDSQGTIIYGEKTIQESGAPLTGFFIRDNAILDGHSTIKAFIEDKGAKTSGSRIDDYYPLNLAKIMENSNIFLGSFWKSDSAAKELINLEKENLILKSHVYLLNDWSKSHVFDSGRVCFQGGKMLSNLIYYRSEKSGSCYGNGDGTCDASFNDFPLFKTCSSLTNLKDSIDISRIWTDYAISCNFNSNFATLPSFTYQTNLGYSYCHFKNLDKTNSNDSIIIGFGVGNSQVEGDFSNLELTVEGLFESKGVTISDINDKGTVDLRVKGVEQKVIDMGKSRQVYTGDDADGNPQYRYETYSIGTLTADFNLNYRGNVTSLSSDKGKWQMLAEPLIGTHHISSYQNTVSSNYILAENIYPNTVAVKKYEVVIPDDNQKFYVYINEYNDWYLVANFDIDITTIFEEYGTATTTIGPLFTSVTYYEDIGIPSRTPERLLIVKQQDGQRFTLTEESETLAYKNQTFYPTNPYTRYPIYSMKITNVVSDFCETYFSFYDYEDSRDLPYDDHGPTMSCKVESGDVYIKLNERLFSYEYSPDGKEGVGYLLLRDILYP